MRSIHWIPSEFNCAEIGKRIGRKALAQVAQIVRPETILGWHRKLIANQGRSAKARLPNLKLLKLSRPEMVPIRNLIGEHRGIVTELRNTNWTTVGSSTDAADTNISAGESLGLGTVVYRVQKLP